MGDEIAKLYVELTAKTDKFASDISSAEAHGSASADKLSKAFLGMATVVGGGMIALGGFAIKASDDLDVANKKLETAAKAANVQMSSLNPIIQQADSRLERYGYTNAATTTAMATLTEAHIPLGQQLEVVQHAADLAAARHIDLETALKAELMAAQGSGKALKEYGINLPPTIDGAKALAGAQTALQKAQENLNVAVHDHGEQSKQAATAQLKLHDAQAKVNKITEEQANHFEGLDQTMSALSIFNGQAQAHSETLAGNIDHLKASFTDIAATLGKDVMPYATGFTHWAESDAMPVIQNMEGFLVHSLVPGLVQVGQAIGPVAVGVGGGMLTGFKFLADHSLILEELFSVWASKMLIIKSLDMANWIREFSLGFGAMTEGAGRFQAVMSTFGMSGSESIGFKMQQLRGETQMEADLLSGRYVLSAESAAAASRSVGVAAESSIANQAIGATEEAAASTVGWGSKLASIASFAIPGIGIAAGVLAPIVISHWDDIMNSFKSSEQKLQDFRNNLYDTRAAASSALVPNLSGFANARALATQIGDQTSATGEPEALRNALSQQKDMENQLAAAKQRVAQQVADMRKFDTQMADNAPAGKVLFPDVTGQGAGQWLTIAQAIKKVTDEDPQVQQLQSHIDIMHLPSDITQDWDKFGTTAQAVFTELSSGKNVDTTGINQWSAALKAAGGDSEKALQSLATTGDANLQKIVADLNQTAAIRFDSTIQSFSSLKDQLIQSGMATDAADAAARKFFPTIDTARTSLQHEADQLTGGNVPALESLIKTNPQLTQQMKDQADAAEAAAKKAAALAFQWDNFIRLAPSVASAFDQVSYANLAGKVSLPQLARLATGGLVRGGSYTAAVIGEEEDEIVLPKSKASSGLWSAAMAALSGGGGQYQGGGSVAMVAGGGGGGSISVGDIVVQDSNRAGQTAAEIREMLIELARSNGITSLFGQFG